MVDIEIKKRCVELCKTKTAREIYDEYYSELFPETTLEGFKRTLRKWKHLPFADEAMLSAGTFEGFTAHNATVQVDGKGNVTQLWVKQSIGENQIEQLIEQAEKGFKPLIVEPVTLKPQKRMLEIPLFDMHFGVSDMEYYRPTLERIFNIIYAKQWEEINIIIGQDLLHNDDFRGRTSKGTPIEQVDMVKAWGDAYSFYYNIITAALKQAKTVRSMYSVGNHDESMSWAFVKCLEAAFPQVKFEVSLLPRKVMTWENIAVGFGHCEYTRNDQDVFDDFMIDFMKEFAYSEVREIHLGHEHVEKATPKKSVPKKESYDFGIMIRRLPTANRTDNWSKKNGYIGAHKRFQLFEYCPSWLDNIHYV